MKKIFTVLLIVFAINLFCVDPGTSPALTYKRILFLESNSLTDTYKKLYDGGGLNLEGFEVPFKLKLTGMMFNDANELIFRESGSRINSYGVGLLNLLADSEIDLITLTLDINASSGVDISNDLVINGTTASTSYTTGSVIIDGGVGIAKDVYINEDLNVEEITNLDNTNIVGAVNIDATTYDIDASTSVDIDASAGTIQIGVNSAGRPITIGNPTSEATVGDNLTVTGTLKQTGASEFTGLVTADALTATGTSTLSTVDINAGAIDGTTIGATSATTGKFTTLSTSEVLTASGSIALNTSELILDADGHESITSDRNGQIDIKIGGTDELMLDATQLYPYTNAGLNLGKQDTREFGSIYLEEDVDCEGDLVVGDDASIGGDATIGGATTIDGALTVGAITTDGINYGNGITAIANTYLVTLSPALDAYVAGQMITMKPASDNSAGASTLNVNGLGAVTILTVSGAAPAAVDILATGISILVYNGTNFILINPATTCD